MRVLGFAVVACASLVLIGTSYGVQEKTNADKIVGVWDLVKGGKLPEGTKAQFTFTKDGKIKMQFSVNDKEIALPDATYKVEGDKITITSKNKGGEKTETNTIKTLTDTTMIIRNDKKDEEVEFKRKKD